MTFMTVIDYTLENQFLCCVCEYTYKNINDICWLSYLMWEFRVVSSQKKGHKKNMQKLYSNEIASLP